MMVVGTRSVGFVTILMMAYIFGLALCMEFTEKDLSSGERLWDLYERWRSHHTVTRDAAEKQKRFNVFRSNVDHIHKANQMDKPYKLKLNKFADMTSHEFRNLYTSNINHHRMLYGSRSNTGFMHGEARNLPEAFDWRQRGAVTPIKDQGNCGSCWAFSTVVGVEGINKIKTGNLVSLSEQELVDCAKDNEGCQGGFMENAYKFIKERGGLTTEVAYPYKAEKDQCDAEKMNSPVVKIDGYENVPPNDEEALLKAAARQRVSVAIDAGSTDLQFYSEGVFTGRCGTDLNHGVGLVGYGATVDGIKYWIVKNSWGTGWGEQGYLRMERGVKAKEGLCGIAMDASYPVKLSPDNPKTQTKDEL